jgi:quercetin dioxygenase-like cupin family protein
MGQNARNALVMMLALSCSTHAEAQDMGAPLRKLPNEIEFKGLAAAPQIAVLFGDPSKPGFYVARVRFPKGTKVMPHSHPDSPRTIAVLAGTLYLGFGEQWDEGKLAPLPPGTFFTEPANAAHFAWAKDDDVIVQLTSMGPTANNPVSNPQQAGTGTAAPGR